MRSLQIFPRLQEACPYSCLAAFSLSPEFSQERNKPLWGRVCPFELLMHSVLFLSPGGLRDSLKSSLIFLNLQTRNSKTL